MTDAVLPLQQDGPSHIDLTFEAQLALPCHAPEVLLGATTPKVVSPDGADRIRGMLIGLAILLEHGGLVSDKLSWTFATCRIFGIGKATRAFQAHRRAGASWQAPGQRSAGNGVLMRIAPAVAWCDLLMRLLASEVPDGSAWWLDAYLR